MSAEDHLVCDELIDRLGHALPEAERQRNLVGMARYGINTAKALGIPNSVVRPMARDIGRDHARALALWETGWREARLLAIFTENPKEVGLSQARQWAADLDSWEITDHLADLLMRAGLWQELIPEFIADEREFVRRLGFALMVSAAVHRKREPDETFIAFLPLAERHSHDARNFVRKAVNWAIRQIGKRSAACHPAALALAQRLAASDDRTARWIGSDARRELESEAVRKRLARTG